jgi:hypothetical protein
MKLIKHTLGRHNISIANFNPKLKYRNSFSL